MELTDKQKEAIEAELYYSFNDLDVHNVALVKYIKERVAPAIFKILEKEEK